ncbi:LysR family transcriptional regulator [Nonomuraea sp. K271]|nr:LysR family transcriptional regulator [Nonomuraea sp. K271]
MNDYEQLAARLASDLALIATVGETGHVTRAAELLGIPQPTASRRLAALAEGWGWRSCRAPGRPAPSRGSWRSRCRRRCSGRSA